MHYNRQWQYGMGVLAFVWSLGLSLPQAQAFHIGCGAILGPGGTFVLDSDVGPCGGPGPALTLISATLDLAGHTVSCSTTSIYGIEVEGKKSRVRNGTVSGCGNGVVLFDQGSYEVREVTASGNTAGFNVGSSGNKLTDNAASSNEEGFSFVGHTNDAWVGNTASGNGGFGFSFGDGAMNSLDENRASGN